MINLNDSKLFTVNDVKDAIKDSTSSEIRKFSPSYFEDEWKYNNFLALKKNFKELFNSMKLYFLFEKDKDKTQFEILLNIKTKSIKIVLNRGCYPNIPFNIPKDEDPMDFYFNTLIYTTKYSTFNNVFNKGFHECEQFDFDDILDSFKKYVFPELLTKLNYLSISNHPITESLITEANYREFSIKNESAKISYNDNYDFLDFKELKVPNYWSKNAFSFLEEGKINKDGSGMLLPINFIDAEDIVNAVLKPEMIINSKTNNRIEYHNDYGSDYYLLDFSNYLDKQHLLQLIQQNDIIDLFPYFAPIQKAADKFIRHIIGFPNQLTLNCLNEDFCPVYKFTKKKFEKGEDLSFVIYILCEQIATILKDNIVGKRLFLQQMWDFLTEFLDIQDIAQKVFTSNEWNNILNDKNICTTTIVDLDKPLTIQDLNVAKFYYNTKVENVNMLEDWKNNNYQIIDMSVIKNQLNQTIDDEDLKENVLKLIKQVYVYTIQDFRKNAIVKERCQIDGHHCEFLMKIK